MISEKLKPVFAKTVKQTPNNLQMFNCRIQLFQKKLCFVATYWFSEKYLHHSFSPHSVHLGLRA